MVARRASRSASKACWATCNQLPASPSRRERSAISRLPAERFPSGCREKRLAPLATPSPLGWVLPVLAIQRPRAGSHRRRCVDPRLPPATLAPGSVSADQANWQAGCPDAPATAHAGPRGWRPAALQQPPCPCGQTAAHSERTTVDVGIIPQLGPQRIEALKSLPGTGSTSIPATARSRGSCRIGMGRRPRTARRR